MRNQTEKFWLLFVLLIMRFIPIDNVKSGEFSPVGRIFFSPVGKKIHPTGKKKIFPTGEKLNEKKLSPVGRKWRKWRKGEERGGRGRKGPTSNHFRSGS